MYPYRTHTLSVYSYILVGKKSLGLFANEFIEDELSYYRSNYLTNRAAVTHSGISQINSSDRSQFSSATRWTLTLVNDVS